MIFEKKIQKTREVYLIWISNQILKTFGPRCSLDPATDSEAALTCKNLTARNMKLCSFLRDILKFHNPTEDKLLAILGFVHLREARAMSMLTSSWRGARTNSIQMRILLRGLCNRTGKRENAMRFPKAKIKKLRDLVYVCRP